MTDRNEQRVRVSDFLYLTAGLQLTIETLDKLIDAGIEVPEPEKVKPGTAGTATVVDEPWRGTWGIDPDDGSLSFWYVMEDGRMGAARADHVTDFTPDPEPLTFQVIQSVKHALRGELYSKLNNNLVNEIVDNALDLLDPYVAKDGA